MKYQKGDHLQVIGSNIHGIVADAEDLTFKAQVKSMQQHWYLLENDGLGLENHWMPESKLEFHKQTLRANKLDELGILGECPIPERVFDDVESKQGLV